MALTRREERKHEMLGKINAYCATLDCKCEVCKLREHNCGNVEYNNIEEMYNLISGESDLTKATTKDNVNHPAHYTAGGIECIDALKAATVDLTGIEAVCTANAIKYLWRWKNKNGVEDLKKAKWYIDRLIEERSMSNGREK